jgi:hypothetical protein
MSLLQAVSPSAALALLLRLLLPLELDHLVDGPLRPETRGIRLRERSPAPPLKNLTGIELLRSRSGTSVKLYRPVSRLNMLYQGRVSCSRHARRRKPAKRKPLVATLPSSSRAAACLLLEQYDALREVRARRTLAEPAQ